MRRLLGWFGERLELEDSVMAVLRHPVPASLERPIGWFYVSGSAVLTVFIVQIVTGVALAMTYVPAPNSAYASLEFITHGALLGELIRGMHYWGATLMVVLVLAHMTQVYLFGAHKFPRELNWMSGSLLLLATLAMAFTGQLLRWDQDAYWAIVVAAEQAGRAPVIGPALAQLVVAGTDVGGATLTRFFATHVFLIPALMFGLVGGHLYLVIKRGISEPPEPGRPIDPRTYRQRYRAILEKGIPFYPDVVWRDVVVAFVVVVIVIVLAAVFGPPGLGAPADPTAILADPRPDWYFLGYFALLAIIPPVTETIVILGLPILAFLYLFLLPVMRPGGERHWSRRPAAIAVVILPLVAYVALTIAGVQSPWAPILARKGPLPAAVTAGLTPRARHGAEIFVDKDCWACHEIDGSGGRKGPDLSAIGERLPADRIVERILRGGGGMPSYAGRISPGDLDDLVTFLEGRKGQ